RCQPLHRLDVADRYGPAKTLALPPVLALGDDLPPRLRLRERREVRAVQPADDAANQPHSHHPTAIQNGRESSAAFTQPTQKRLSTEFIVFSRPAPWQLFCSRAPYRPRRC